MLACMQIRKAQWSSGAGAFVSLSMSSSEVVDWSQIIIIPAGKCLPVTRLTEIQIL